MYIVALAVVLGLTLLGYQIAGVSGAVSGLISSFLAISSLSILLGSKGAEIATQPTVRMSQRISGGISAAAIVAGTLALGWNWGWIGGIAGYLLGALSAKPILLLLAKRQVKAMYGPLMTERSSAPAPTFRLMPLEEFLAQTFGGRPNQMDMSAYEGAKFDCACGSAHSYQASSVVVVRELTGMRLIFRCPVSEALTCVAIDGILKFRRFRTLFGTSGERQE